MGETKRKKVVGFTAGRRGGNTEIYMKVALQAISEMGIDVELIRLHECDLHPCVDCTRGMCYVKGPEGCIFKDDGPWLAQKFLESDGYLLGAPVWSLSPCGIVTDFRVSCLWTVKWIWQDGRLTGVLLNGQKDRSNSVRAD